MTDKDILEEAKRAVRCLPLAIPDGKVCADVSRILSGVIQEVEKLRKEIKGCTYQSKQYLDLCKIRGKEITTLKQQIADLERRGNE